LETPLRTSSVVIRLIRSKSNNPSKKTEESYLISKKTIRTRTPSSIKWWDPHHQTSFPHRESSDFGDDLNLTLIQKVFNISGIRNNGIKHVFETIDLPIEGSRYRRVTFKNSLDFLSLVSAGPYFDNLRKRIFLVKYSLI
jgi:hypothetical protein